MKKHKRHGSALVTSMVALVFVFTAGSGLLALSMQSMRRSRFDVLRPKALALADAGVEKALFYLRTVAPDGSHDGSWRTNSLTEQVPGVGSYTVRVQSGTGDNAGKVVITSVGRATDGYQGTSGGSGGVLPVSYTAPTGIQVARGIRVAATVEREDISIWNNAIFGGVGQGGRSIQGNVRIRGSVHLLGDGEDYTDTDGDGHWDAGETYTDKNFNGRYDAGEPFTDADADGHFDAKEPFVDVNGNGTREPALTVTDLSSEFGGDANIGNNYSGMPTDLRGRIPDPGYDPYRGETLESLKAKLRVKNGQVSLNGSATVGDPNVTGNSTKETMDGVYVSDGFTGNAGTSHVYADNGTKEGYNLGNMVDFPTLLEKTTKNGVTYSSYMEYLKANALVLNNSITLKPGVAYGPVTDGKGNSLYVTATGNVQISGIVYVNGDITFDKNGGQKSMTYSGRGTVVATGDISVQTDLVPTLTFPTAYAMGFIARKNMYLGTSSQLSLAGAFYAQQTISSTKQNELAGTFVSSYFAMQNVPHMYQVPKLVDNLPPGMPGADRIWVKHVRIDSWREVPPTGLSS